MLGLFLFVCNNKSRLFQKKFYQDFLDFEKTIQCEKLRKTE